jgi:hypothetical protein
MNKSITELLHQAAQYNLLIVALGIQISHKLTIPDQINMYDSTSLNTIQNNRFTILAKIVNAKWKLLLNSGLQKRSDNYDSNAKIGEKWKSTQKRTRKEYHLNSIRKREPLSIEIFKNVGFLLHGGWRNLCDLQ